MALPKPKLIAQTPRPSIGAGRLPVKLTKG